MAEQIMTNLYKIEIPLPNNPLRFLNSYVVAGESQSLVIDTGFNMPECLEALLSGIYDLGIDSTNLDVLSTHFHADHTGLISQLITDRSKVYMSSTDSEMFKEAVREDGKYWDVVKRKYLEEGYPISRLSDAIKLNPAKTLIDDSGFDIVPLEEGDELDYGGFHWKVVLTPGHTPGHLCLYEPDHKILITGDHLLFDISPNITWWDQVEDSLGSYMASLDKISSLDVETVLTGHRRNQGDLRERVFELQRHHHERLCEILDIVSQEPCITSYEIASKMSWRMPTKWINLSPIQRWFAVGEAISHVEHLVHLGKLERYKNKGVNHYFIERQNLSGSV